MRLFSLLGPRELLVGAFLLLLPMLAVSQSAPSGVDSTRKGSSNLRPGDLVLVRIWREPDLSDTVHVDNDGVAVFPIVKGGLLAGASVGGQKLKFKAAEK